jgi:uroporphyrin-III C-methyltransferase/precorrin-2 dehydrogenase/sirohydrochlorin ferrochelatase
LAWKRGLILAAGAKVRMCSDPVEPEDFADIAFAIGDYEDLAEAQAFADMARAAHVLVNLVDKPALSDVQFGAIVNRSPIVAAIATDGKAPSLGRAIRGRIEALLPPELSQWATAADDWRAKTQHLSGPAKRQFWADYANLALRAAKSAPTPALIAPLLEQAGGRRDEMVVIETGTSGRADQITLQALGILQRCDCIVTEDGIPQGVLDWARREAIIVRAAEVATADLPPAPCIAWLTPKIIPNAHRSQVALGLGLTDTDITCLYAGR